MSLGIVTFCYAVVVALAMGVLYLFGSLRWYWHSLGIAAALVLGSVPMSTFGPSVSPLFDLGLGGVIVFLLVWGLAAPFFQRPHTPVHHH